MVAKVERMEKKPKRKGVDKTSSNLKSKRPQPKKVLAKTKKARIALASGQISQAESEVKKQRDLRTLYVKFKKNFPTNLESMKQLFPQSQCVRAKHQEKTDTEYKYCFVEYNSEAACELAKSQLEGLSDLYFVDFVGEKSRNVKQANTNPAKRRPVNPVRLCVTGIPDDMAEDKLRLLFPKSIFAIVKRKKSAGFVTFQNPGDARAAFDKVRRLMEGDLPPGVPKLTVVFAKIENLSKRAAERQKKRKEAFDHKIAENFIRKPNEKTTDEEDEEESDNDAEKEEDNANETESDDGDEPMANDEKESDDDEESEDDDVANDEESDDE